MMLTVIGSDPKWLQHPFIFGIIALLTYKYPYLICMANMAVIITINVLLYNTIQDGWPNYPNVYSHFRMVLKWSGRRYYQQETGLKRNRWRRCWTRSLVEAGLKKWPTSYICEKYKLQCIEVLIKSWIQTPVVITLANTDYHTGIGHWQRHYQYSYHKWLHWQYKSLFWLPVWLNDIYDVTIRRMNKSCLEHIWSQMKDKLCTQIYQDSSLIQYINEVYLL